MVVLKRPEPELLEGNLINFASQKGMLEVKNGVYDKAGSILKRKGLSKNKNASGLVLPVFGLYWWESKRQLVTIVAGKIFKTRDPATDDEDISGTTSIRQAPILFADTGYWLYMCADDGRMIKWDGESATAETELTPVAPEKVSAIEAFNTRILANEVGTNRIWYTQPANITTPQSALVWDGYFEVDRNGEEIVGMKRLGSELIVFKKKSFNAYYDDGTTPFRHITGSDTNIGLASRSALVAEGDALFFLTHNRRVIKLQDGTPKDISTGYMQKRLESLVFIDDAIVYILDNKLVLTFPTENKTYVYDIIYQKWSEFTLFENGLDKEFIGRCAVELPAVGSSINYLIGGKDGWKYLFDHSMYTDNGEPINFLLRTTHLDWGTNNRKRSNRLTVKVSLKNPYNLEGSGSFPDEIAFPDATRCEMYSFTPELEEGYRLTSVDNLPSGLTYNPSTGVISGGVTSFVGIQEISYTITNPQGGSKTFYTNLEVLDLVFTVEVS